MKIFNLTTVDARAGHTRGSDYTAREKEQQLAGARNRASRLDKTTTTLSSQGRASVLEDP